MSQTFSYVFVSPLLLAFSGYVFLHQEGHTAQVEALQRNCMCRTTRMWALSFKKTFPLPLLFIAAVWLPGQQPNAYSPSLHEK